MRGLRLRISKQKKTCVQLFHYGAKEEVCDCTSPPPPPPTPSSPLNEAIKCLVLLCQAGRAVMHTVYTVLCILFLCAVTL